MTKDLETMWDKNSCIICASKEGSKLRTSDSIEEHASYSVRYAVENFPGFATWLRKIDPNVKCGYK